MAVTAACPRLSILRHPLVQPGCSRMEGHGDEEDGMENGCKSECAPVIAFISQG